MFRGAFDVRASDINDAMKVAAWWRWPGWWTRARNEECIIPALFDPRARCRGRRRGAGRARQRGKQDISLTYRILLVEDDPVIAGEVQHHLTGWGYGR